MEEADFALADRCRQSGVWARGIGVDERTGTTRSRKLLTQRWLSFA